MVNYRRVYVEGGTYFFTVTLKNLKLDYLTTYVNELRESFSHVKKQQPFEIIAIVVLPEHFHCLWQLPEGDKNYAGRWRASSPYGTKCNTGHLMARFPVFRFAAYGLQNRYKGDE